jgi:glycine oxidase
VLDRETDEGRFITEESNVLEPEAFHDVLVVGAGLIGSSIAWLLAKAGCRAVLIDAGRFGGEASAAGAGMLAPGGEYRVPSPAARFAIESLAMYPTFVRQLGQESGLSIDYRKSGAIELAYESERWRELRKRADVQRRFGISVQLLCPSSLGAVAPGLNLEGLRGALYYPDDACVAPGDLLQALRAVCEREGVKILENRPVGSIEAESGRVTVRVREQKVSGRNLVLAAGAWSSQIPVSRSGDAVHIPESFPVKGHLVGYQLLPGSLRPILRNGHHYVVQRNTGFTIAGSSEERCGFNRIVNPDRISEICHAAASFYTPISMLEPTREWVGFRPASERQAPTLGRVPGTTVWLAYGHYRNGILLTPATAHLVSSQILEISGRSCALRDDTPDSLAAPPVSDPQMATDERV